MSNEKYPWPQFQLTAYVLGELKPDVAAQIRVAAEHDAALANEIAEIKSMVDQLSELYQHETAGIEATSFDAASARSVVSEVSASSVKTASQKISWSAAVGLLAMAASLLIAVVLAAPALRSYFLEPNDALAKADGVQNLAVAEAENKQLARKLEQAKEELSGLQASRASGLLKEQSATSSHDARTRNVVNNLHPEPLSQDEPVAASLGALPSSEQQPLGQSEQARLGFPSEPETNHPFAAPVAVPDGGNMLLGGIRRGLSDPNAVPESKFALGGMGDGDMSEYGMSDGEMAESGVGMGGMGMGMEGGMGMGPGAPSVAMTVTPRIVIDDVEEEAKYDSLSATGNEHRARNDRPFRRKNPNADRYTPIYENSFKSVESEPLSTFSIDVDTASYVKTRQFLMETHSLPPANAVRIEEFVNYFEYEYAGPQGEDPFAANLAVATCPWRTDHKLVRIALQAKKVDVSERPKANIVFLLDVSGSMDEPNKLPLVKESMRMMIQQLGENDRVAMVVYAGAAGCVLESTTGDKQELILGALDRLNAGGSTNGGQGIQLAYNIARDHFVPGGVNRVILCTDGDFNVGTTSTDALVNLVAENAKSKVFLTVLGYGMGNTNDAMMEQISNKGNGVYSIVDSRREAQRQMIKQLAGNLMTVAKDVKIQVEFNPQRVASYRLIGYENRMLAAEDFANDKKDAGEIGAGHRVTALYEIEPIGAARVPVPATEELRYQKSKPAVDASASEASDATDETSDELLAVKLRYKQPEGDTSKLLTFPLIDSQTPFAEADQDFKWAASVAQFAMLLRGSNHKGSASWSSLVESAQSVASDESRRECMNMIRRAAAISREQ